MNIDKKLLISYNIVTVCRHRKKEEEVALCLRIKYYGREKTHNL